MSVQGYWPHTLGIIDAIYFVPRTAKDPLAYINWQEYNRFQRSITYLFTEKGIKESKINRV